MKKLFPILILTCAICSNGYLSNGQSKAEQLDSASIEKVRKFVDRQDKKIVFFGFSVGIRSGFKSESESRAVATILPDSTHAVSIEYLDQLAFILSTSMTAFPFKIERH